MAVPKKKTSRAKKRSRRAHDSVRLPHVSTCPQCHEPVLSHHVCLKCGSYKGREIVKSEES